MQTLLGKHWHHFPVGEVITLLESNLQSGLDVFEVKHRQEHFGPNVLTAKRGKGPLTRFLYSAVFQRLWQHGHTAPVRWCVQEFVVKCRVKRRAVLDHALLRSVRNFGSL